MKAMRNLSYGMYIIGASDKKLGGCVVNTVSQISNDPVLITVSINHDNYTNKMIKDTKKFSVSVLGEDTDPSIIGTFGYKSSKDIEKFNQTSYELLEDLPVLKEAICSFTCEVKEMLETKTHTIFLAEVQTEKINSSKKPMTYRYYQEVLKGKSPAKAPTYEEEKSSKEVWKCTLCGYEVELEELPPDFKCPICGAPITVFEKVRKED